MPGILNQLGPDSLASLRKLAESYQHLNNLTSQNAQSEAGNDDDIPELVENFEVTSEKKEEEEAEAAEAEAEAEAATDVPVSEVNKVD